MPLANNYFMKKNIHTKGFTLLELLIVIAIIAILATILVIVINPAESLRRARDVQRMSDLSTLKTSIALYLTLNPSASLGQCSPTPGTAPTMVYYSLASNASNDTTVAGAASANTRYVAAADAGKIDGNGWIAIDFATGITGGSPISNLPVDPVNTRANAGSATASDLTYRYACAASPTTFELNATLESAEFATKHGTDGGNNSSIYEVGTRLDILPATSDF